MKKILFLGLLICIILTSCTSVKSMSDYDEVTWAEKDYYDQKILGEVKVTTLGFTWETLKPQSNKTKVLMNRLEKKAIRKYGKNIDIVNVDIGGMDGLSTTMIWSAGGTAAMALIISALENVERTDNSQGEKQHIYTDEETTRILLGYIPFFAFMFKGIQANATVIKSDSIYQKGEYKLISEDEIYDKRKDYNSRKYEIEYERRRLQNELQLEKDQNQLSDLRTRLIRRGKNTKSPIVILDKGISTINSADGVSCYVDFINISDKLAKYVNIDVTPYNRVFDQAYSHIDGSSNKTVNVTNFIGPNEEYRASWENVWYNSTILTMKVTKVEMIFSDNTKLIIDDPELLKTIEFSTDENLKYKELSSSINNLMK